MKGKVSSIREKGKAGGLRGYWELREEEGLKVKRDCIMNLACRLRKASFCFIFTLSMLRGYQGLRGELRRRARMPEALGN